MPPVRPMGSHRRTTRHDLKSPWVFHRPRGGDNVAVIPFEPISEGLAEEIT